MATYYPSSGAIDLNSVNTLFGRGHAMSNYAGTTYYTSSGGPFTFPSSNFAFSAFYGTGPTANRVSISYTFTSNATNASLNITSIGGYTAGTTDVTVTVNSGVYLYSTSTGTAGLALTGGTSGDTLTLVNNGYIMGQGGNGGGTSWPNGSSGCSGGTALSLGYCITINNTNGSAYIGGGGGGGGGSSGVSCVGKFLTLYYVGGAGGGGAGGGAGGTVLLNVPCCTGGTSFVGGTGGSPGSSGSNSYYTAGCDPSGAGSGGGAGGAGYSVQVGGGGGGRIFPGVGGHATYTCFHIWTSGDGGSGSGAGASPGGGGGWGANGSGGVAGNVGGSVGTGGSGGKAVQLNGRSVTWVSSCVARVYGSVS